MTKFEAIQQLSRNVEKIQELIKESKSIANEHNLNFEFNSSRVGYSENVTFDSSDSWSSSSC